MASGRREWHYVQRVGDVSQCPKYHLVLQPAEWIKVVLITTDDAESLSAIEDRPTAVARQGHVHAAIPHSDVCG